jgi:O-antigen/teichoic acid export membrane protein
MLSKLGSLSDVGQYAVANRVSNVLLLAVTGFVLAFGPYVFSIYARDPELEKQVRGKTLTYLIICLTAAALALTLFAQELISIVAPAFDDAYKAVGLLTFSVVAFGVSTVVMAGIAIVRRTKVLALLAGVAAAINIGLNFVLIPPFGMVGAAVATAVAYAVLAALNFQVAQRYYRTPYERQKVLTALGLASVVGILGVVPLGPAPVAILVKALALGGYLALLRVFHVIEASDLASIREILSGLKLTRWAQP